MLKSLFYACTVASLFSLPAFAVDEKAIEQESVISCKDCKILACGCGKEHEKPKA